MRDDVEKVKTCLLGTSCHTYSNSLILSLDDLPTCKATEADEPLVAAVGIIPSPIAAAGLVGYWLCLKIISRSLTLTLPLIEKAKLLSKLTREIWIMTAAEVYTMKCHFFFDHAMEEEITTYGSAYQWTSCPFESHHRRLQIRINQSTTNSANTIIEKYLLFKRVRALSHEKSTNAIPSLLALKDKVENCHKKRFPLDIRISEVAYIPKNSRISLADMRPSERTRISRSDDEPYSRLVVHNKVYSSNIYWKRKKTSRQDLVYFEDDDGTECFGSIIIFLYNRRNNTVRVLIDEYESCDPFSHLRDLVNHIPHPCRRIALNLMRLIRENNCYFRELTGKTTRVRCGSSIRGACSLLKYGNRTYVSRA